MVLTLLCGEKLGDLVPSIEDDLSLEVCLLRPGNLGCCNSNPLRWRRISLSQSKTTEYKVHADVGYSCVKVPCQFHTEPPSVRGTPAMAKIMTQMDRRCKT